MYSPHDNKEIVQSRTNYEGKPLLTVGQSGNWPIYAQKLPFHIDGISATPRRFMHSIGHSKGQAVGRFKPFDKEKDTLEIYDHTKDGKDIISLNFNPLLWFDLPFFEVVLFHAHYTE